ncbi:Oligopeptide transporter [Quillaja saponaria]|uniref:Oligopeptide transporter n=1 Tax=Quillaja saponaria TaxID=32244 RepID=A0AAD7LPT9_QUISA|nr:Oligopeptide transporter [Quillaja saponaria]
MFTKKGIYPEMNWFFLIGLLAPVPVLLLPCKFPNRKWIRLINMPIILAGPTSMPSAKAVHYICWEAVRIFFNFYISSKFKDWWARHNYILSAGLDSGFAFLAILIYFTLQSKDIIGPSWWGLENDDHCPLASCPTAPGVVSKGWPSSLNTWGLENDDHCPLASCPTAPGVVSKGCPVP